MCGSVIKYPQVKFLAPNRKQLEESHMKIGRMVVQLMWSPYERICQQKHFEYAKTEKLWIRKKAPNSTWDLPSLMSEWTWANLFILFVKSGQWLLDLRLPLYSLAHQTFIRSVLCIKRFPESSVETGLRLVPALQNLETVGKKFKVVKTKYVTMSGKSDIYVDKIF